MDNDDGVDSGDVARGWALEMGVWKSGSCVFWLGMGVGGSFKLDVEALLEYDEIEKGEVWGDCDDA